MYRCGCHDPIVFGHLNCARWQTQPRVYGGRPAPRRQARGGRLTLQGIRPSVTIYDEVALAGLPPRPA